MKCKWAVMSTITSTREPSTWLLSSQIDEPFPCHCPLLTSLGGRVPSERRVGARPGVGGEAENWRRAGPWQRAGRREPPPAPQGLEHPGLAVPLPAPSSSASPPPSLRGRWGSICSAAGKPPPCANERKVSRGLLVTLKNCAGWPGQAACEQRLKPRNGSLARKHECHRCLCRLCSQATNSGERRRHFQESGQLRASATALPRLGLGLAGCVDHRPGMVYPLQTKSQRMGNVLWC